MTNNLNEEEDKNGTEYCMNIQPLQTNNTEKKSDT